MSLLDLTPSGIFETLTFDLPKHIDPLSRFINPAVECPCEAMVLSRACMESYPVPPLLVLFFATGGSAWTLSRELVGTAAGVDFWTPCGSTSRRTTRVIYVCGIYPS